MKKRLLITLIVAVVGAFLLEGLQLLTEPKGYQYQMTKEVEEQEISLYPDKVIYMAGYDQEGDALRVSSADPQIMLNTSECEAFSNVSLYFSTAPTSVIPIQIYYDQDGALSESNSIKGQISAGSPISSFTIPKGKYSMIRVDVDGNIALQSIRIGNMVPVKIPVAERIHWLRIAVVFIVLTIVVFWLLSIHAGKRFIKTIQGGIRGIRQEGKKAILKALIFPVCAGIAVLITWLLFGTGEGAVLKWPIIVLAAIIGLNIGALIVFRKTLKEQPEYIFLIICISLGVLVSFFVPHAAENSWDDGYHYRQALISSYVDEIRMTKQDQAAIDHWQGAEWNLDNLEPIHQAQDELYRDGAETYPAHVQISSVVESFNGLGLFVGRILGLRYYLIEFTGRLFGLLTYAFLGFFAIRKIKSGKMIVATILLIPTAIYLASSFNYDSYIIGLLALGMCYYSAQWQNPDEKLTLNDAMVIIGSIMIGCLTKAVYIPILWIAFILPKTKFPSKKIRNLYYGAIVAATVFVFLCLFLPNLLGKGKGALAEDVRGGSEVSTVGQIQYMIAHPFDYLNTFWRFLMNEYLNPTRVHELLTNYAYHGFMPNQYIYLLLLGVVIFTDKNEYDLIAAQRPSVRIVTYIMTAGGLFLTVTALYVYFTSVGATTVAGASFRYMLPLLIPAFLFMGSGLLNNKMNRGLYNGLILSISAYVNYVAIYFGFIGKYF